MALDLFGNETKKRAGASPWERYKAKRGDLVDLKIGFLTSRLPERVYLKLVRKAEQCETWRKQLEVAIESICDT